MIIPIMHSKCTLLYALLYTTYNKYTMYTSLLIHTQNDIFTLCMVSESPYKEFALLRKPFPLIMYVKLQV